MKSASTLSDLIKQIGDQKYPPVHLWNPDFCGKIDMRIASDGTWYYMGSPIGRAKMVRLFSSVLRYDDGIYYLVTPVEKLEITVDDAPFLVTAMEYFGEGRAQIVTFTTRTEDVIKVDAEHPFFLEDAFDTENISNDQEKYRPYVLVRGGMKALIGRSVYYELVNLALNSDNNTNNGVLGFWSSGQFFELGSLDQDE